MAPKQQRNIKDTSSILLSTLKQDDRWSAQVNLLKSKYKGTKNGVAKIHQLTGELQTVIVDGAMGRKELLSAIQQLEEVADGMREGSCDEVVGLIEQHISKHAKNFEEELRKNIDDASYTPTETFFADVEAFFDCVVKSKVLGKSASWVGIAPKCRERIPILEGYSTRLQFMEAIEKFEDKDMLDLEKLRAISLLNVNFDRFGVDSLQKSDQDRVRSATRAAVDAIISKLGSTPCSEFKKDHLELIVSITKGWVTLYHAPTEHKMLVKHLGCVFELFTYQQQLVDAGLKDEKEALSDDHRTVLDNTISALVEAQSTSAQCGEQMVNFAKNLTKDLYDTYILPIRDRHVAKAKTALDIFLERSGYEGMVGGVGDGTVWHSSLGENYTLEDVEKKAKTSIQKFVAKDFSDSNKRVAALLKVYVDLREFFNATCDEEYEKKVTDLYRRGFVTEKEGILCICYAAHKQNTAAMKKGCGPARKALATYQDLVLPALWTMMTKANAFERVTE